MKFKTRGILLPSFTGVDAVFFSATALQQPAVLMILREISALYTKQHFELGIGPATSDLQSRKPQAPNV